MALGSSVNAADIESGSRVISPSQPIQTWEASEPLAPGESVSLTVTVVEQETNAQNKTYKLYGTPTASLSGKDALWTTITEGPLVFKFRAVNMGKFLGTDVVTVSATWKETETPPPPSNGKGSGASKVNPLDIIKGWATGFASSLYVIKWKFDPRLQFADGQSLIHWTVSVSDEGAALDLSDADVTSSITGAQLTTNAHGSPTKSKSGTITSAAAAIGVMEFELGGAVARSVEQISFDLPDLELTSATGTKLDEDRPKGEIAASTPNEVDPGKIIIAPVTGSSEPAPRSELTLKGNRDYADAEFTLEAAGLPNLAIYTSPTEKEPLQLPHTWKAEELPSSLYLEVIPFTSAAAAQDGNFTLTYKQTLQAGPEDFVLKDSARIRLVPFDMVSDLNNDGKVSDADRKLKTDGEKADATDEQKEKATDYIFANDDVSNGAWDKDDDTDSTKPSTAKDDDDAEEISVTCAATWGAVWFNHPAIALLSFYKTKECKEEDKVTFPFALSTEESGKLPEKLYVRLDGDGFAKQAEGDLEMKFGKADKSVTWAEDKLKLTAIKQFGDEKYFWAARDYIEESNVPFHVLEREYEGGSTRVISMRDEATRFFALDVRDASRFAAPPNRMKAVVNEAFVQNHSVIVNGVLNSAGSTIGGFSGKVVGQIISNHGVTPTPSDGSVSSTNVGSLIRQTTGPGSIFRNNHKPVATDGEEAIGFLLLPPAGDQSGLEIYIGKRAADISLKPMLFIGYGLGGGQNGKFINDAHASGVVDLNYGGIVEKRLYQLDAGGSRALALKFKGSTAFSVDPSSGFRHLPLFSPERINNYISFKCDLPRP